jgi:hypothetical protein
MDGDAGYALQKLELAIIDLATGSRDIKSRLHSAYINHLHVLQENDFPESLRKDWKSIMELLTRAGPLLNDDGGVLYGSIERTLKGMRYATGTKIANQIICLSEQLRCYLEDITNTP